MLPQGFVTATMWATSAAIQICRTCCRHCCSKSRQRECKRALQELQIKARTKSLNTLTERVAERFPNLRRKTELWKPQRHHRDAQISTKRMDAQLPMVEYNYSGHTAVQKGEVVPPREYHIIKTRSELSATQQMVLNKRWEFKKLFYTADAMHITVNLDGCSVFGKGNLKYQSHSVFYDVRLRHHLAHTFCRATQSA
jgi:hypothetical protein